MNRYSHIEIDGYKIACHRSGSGEAMLLVHGITTYSFIWKEMVSGLSSDFDVIALDLLGCGDSEMPKGVDYSISAQADIIKKLLDELGIKKVHLVCHDIGGGIGQIFAVRYPDRLHDLVLINSVAYDFWPVQPIVSMRTPIIRQLGMALLDIGFFKLLVKRGVYHKERVTDELMEMFYRPVRSAEGKAAFLHLAKCLNNMQLMEIAEDLRKLQLPVLIVRGDADIYLKPEISEKLHSEINTSRLERIPTGGHFIQVDEPELLVKMINRFICENV